MPADSHARGAGLEKELVRFLEQSRAAVVRIQAGAPAEPELARLKSLAGDIRAAHMLLTEKFRLRQDRADSLGPKAAERHSVMTGACHEIIGRYLGAAEELGTGGDISPEALENLKNLLDSALPEKRVPIFGSLPYKNLNYPAREPVTEPAVIPAYKGGTGETSPDDLKSTPEAPLTKEIAELARSLEWNPVLIYEWVKNNVETEWYYGCMKGAGETLRQGSGNDCDQAALLVALLRSAGFPSRYVRGVIEFFPGIEKAMNLAGVEDGAELAKFFRRAGIPFRPVIKGGRIENFQIGHVWVETLVPYDNYRGAVIDGHGKTWIGLDTSIKPAGHTYNEPGEIPGDLPFSQIRDDYLGTVREEMPLEYLGNIAEDLLRQRDPDAAYDDLLRTKTQVPERMGILPASLQFAQTAITGEHTGIPGDLTHRVRFRAFAPGSTDPLFDVTTGTCRLSNRPVALVYEPETVEDQEIINSFGGPGNTPSYLVRLRPVLKTDGERTAVARDGLPMGGEYDLVLDLISPNGTERITNTHITGNLCVMGIISQQAVMPGHIPDEEKDAERLLFEEAVRYADSGTGPRRSSHPCSGLPLPGLFPQW